MSEPRDAGRSTFSLLFRSPLILSVLCPVSFGATALFLGGPWDPNRVQLWHLLMALQPALWLASVLVVFNDFRSHRQDWPGRRSERRAVWLCTLLAGVMNSIPFTVQLVTQRWSVLLGLEEELQLPHMGAKLLLFGLLSSAVSTLHTAGILSVHLQLLSFPREPRAGGAAPGAEATDEEVLEYQRLQSRLERFLVFSAVTIGTATLSFGAFREVLHEFAPSRDLAPSRVMGYGVYYSGLLASVYLPTRRTLTEVGETLAARFVPPAPAAGTSWKEWSQEQQAVRTWLGLQSSSLQDFQQGLSVLAPLLASLSALVLGAGG